jgi:hypothetical protein
MARHEADREDLLAEAVALPRRLEGRSPDNNLLIIAGFRTDGRLSMYFGPDRMYQWDTHGRLRRAYLDGLLYRTQGETLARLERSRSNAETTLLRHDLTPGELAEFRDQMQGAVTPLLAPLHSGWFLIDRQVPADDTTLATDIARHLQTVLAADPWLAEPIAVRR